MATVGEQIGTNSFRLLLLRALGAGTVALVGIAQLVPGNRLDAKGPGWLDPASITSLVVGGVFLGFAYGNISFATAQLEARVENGVLLTAALPGDIKMRAANTQFPIGLAMLAISVGFLLTYLWT